MRRIVLALSHSIEEHDQLKLLHSIGHEVFSIGGFVEPAHPHDKKRPGLPEVPFYPALKASIDALGTPDNLGAAQSRIPDMLLEWADTIIYHHYLDRLYGQWPRIRDWLRGDANRRVIWRTVGQSAEGNEEAAQPFRAEGMEIVRYSPKEEAIPSYAGSDGLIRFYKDPAEWNGWTGDEPVVINITQHLRQRDPYTNWGFWEQATSGLNRMALGPGSEVIGGPGELSYDGMQGWLQRARCYVYTGTQPASYTLGLIEAMMVGIPVLSIGPSWMRIFPYSPLLFEGHEIAGIGSDNPADVRIMVQAFLANHEHAQSVGEKQRARAIDLFGIEKVKADWAKYLA